MIVLLHIKLQVIKTSEFLLHWIFSFFVCLFVNCYSLTVPYSTCTCPRVGFFKNHIFILKEFHFTVLTKYFRILRVTEISSSVILVILPSLFLYLFINIQ